MDESTITAFPLAWPRGYERTPKECRQRSAFGTTKQKVGGVSRWMSRERLSISKAVSRLDAEIRRFTKAGRPWRIVPEEVVISSNLRTRLDGLPMGNQPEPADVGVAIYFRLDGQLTVMCCDKWDRVADNINSVAANVELAEQAPAAKPGKAAAVPRRPITDDEREAVRCLGEQVGYAPATWDKKFARDMYGRRDSGLISEKEAAQVWRMFKRYRRQIRHAHKERLLEVAAVHAAPERKKGAV